MSNAVGKNCALLASLCSRWFPRSWRPRRSERPVSATGTETTSRRGSASFAAHAKKTPTWTCSGDWSCATPCWMPWPVGYAAWNCAGVHRRSSLVRCELRSSSSAFPYVEWYIRRRPGD